MEIDAGAIILILIILIFGLFLPPVRVFLGWVVKVPLPVMWSYTFSVAATIVKAHGVVLKNFQPRRIVLPTLDKDQI